MSVPARTTESREVAPTRSAPPPAPSFPARGGSHRGGAEPSLDVSLAKPNVLGLTAVLLLVGGLGSWAAFAEISGAVIAEGELDVEQRRQIVQHVDGGIVDGIFVAEGATVEAGQVLLRMDGSRARAELGAVEAQYFETLARIARLSAERDRHDAITFPERLTAAAQERPDIAEFVSGQVSLFEARLVTHQQRLDQLGQRQTQIRSLVSGIDAQINAVEQQLALARSELEVQEGLVQRGFATTARVNMLQREVAEHAGNLGDLVARRAEAMERISSTALEALGLVALRQEEAIAQLRELGVSERELAERLRVAEDRIARLEVRAPASGVVYDQSIHTIGAVIGSAEALMYIVPQDQPLVAVARIAANDIDRVHVGQMVELRISAFSARTAQAVPGKIVHVSATTFQDERSRAPYYRARIRIEPDEASGLNGQLVPGMQVVAFVQTEARSPASYLLAPLAEYFLRSFRE